MATLPRTPRNVTQRTRLAVRGIVQGVGFRPFVYRLAQSLGLSGWVLNGPDGVVIEVEGDAPRVAAFAPRLRAELPPLARITALEETPAVPEGATAFVIRESEEGDRPTALIPADIATCPRCAAEVNDPADRRHAYPFTNCTDCGPRFTIVETVPYDRARTTMRAFEMCPACRAEYENPLSRRFHAEPNACPACGPRVWLAAGGERGSGRVGEWGNGGVGEGAGGAAGTGPGAAAGRGPGAAAGAGPGAAAGAPSDPSDQSDLSDAVHRSDLNDPLADTAALLREGRVVAVKGLGGFHLACDARSPAAVRRLRAGKRRQAKPFAVMVRDTAEAERHCTLSEAERSALEAPERPIVLLRARAGSDLAAEVAPGQRTLGVMLPYTPLHHLLLQIGPPALVMTSGNLSEEPIAHDNDEAAHRLAGMADAFLFHDRPIRTPCDDSVLRVFRGEALLVRRSRGFVPRAVRLPRAQTPVLACGGEQKNTFCLTRGDEAVLSQHIGDLDNVETLDYYARAIAHFGDLFRTFPAVVAHDLHPEYLSTRYALEAAGQGARAIGVQHHHAHVVSCMADNGLEGTVIGVAFDGTGYGTDGTLWGGEILVASARGFRRAAHLRPVRLPGGEAAIRRPMRMAYAYLLDAFDGAGQTARQPLPAFDGAGETAGQPLPGFDGAGQTVGQPLPGFDGAGETAGQSVPAFTAEEMAARLLPALAAEERAAVAWQVRTGTNSPFSSGAGRLFDAVSALLGICTEAEYEGQPAIELEMAAGDALGAPYPFALHGAGTAPGTPAGAPGAAGTAPGATGATSGMPGSSAAGIPAGAPGRAGTAPCTTGTTPCTTSTAPCAAGAPSDPPDRSDPSDLSDRSARPEECRPAERRSPAGAALPGAPHSLDLRPAIREVAAARFAGEAAAPIAARFHATVAAAIVAACVRVARETGLDQVCLSGGTFQNMLLLEATVAGLERAGLRPFWHHQVPPNDGGLALGQAVVAGAILEEQ